MEVNWQKAIFILGVVTQGKGNEWVVGSIMFAGLMHYSRSRCESAVADRVILSPCPLS